MKNNNLKIIIRCVIHIIKSSIIQLSGAISIFIAGLLTMAAYCTNENGDIPLTVTIICILLFIAGITACFYNDYKFFKDMTADFADIEKRTQVELDRAREIQDNAFKSVKELRKYLNNAREYKMSNEEGGM